MKEVIELRPVAPICFLRLARKHSKLMAFDPAPLLEAPAPWEWEWKSPLRMQLEAIVGDPAVTAWQTENAELLAAVLREPTGVHKTLLGVSEQPPVVSGDSGDDDQVPVETPIPDAASAEAAE